MSLNAIRKKISTACQDAGRDAGGVTLVAVTKNQPPEKIIPLLDAGHRVFGENRVQDAMEKFPALRDSYDGIELHFIGHLQSNKARDAVKYCDVIQSLDSEKLADALKEEMDRQNRPLPCFIQINTGGEEQKGGISPRALEKFFRFCTEETGLQIRGLMSIPPAGDSAALHFALLHKLAAGLPLPCLSMGMSGDFEAAIRLGATHVRIGTALFGEREEKHNPRTTAVSW